MKKIVPLILLISIVFIAYKKLYQNSEERLQTPSIEANNIQTQKDQLEDSQIDRMMDIV